MQLKTARTEHPAPHADPAEATGTCKPPASGNSPQLPLEPSRESIDTTKAESDAASLVSFSSATLQTEDAEIFIEGVLKKRLAGEDIDLALEVRDGLQRDLESRNWDFIVGEDVLSNIDEARGLLGMLRFNWCQTNLISLRVVEYTGPESFGNLYSVKSVPVHVRFFELASSQPEVNSYFPGAEVYYMPNKKFTSTWDELVFDASHKDDFLTMAINTERLNRTSNKFTMLEDRIILLHGPPGTGKTSLCQGLAQKVSIRLCTVYQHRQLVEIGAATLLSKFFSESAKIVDQIFRSLADRCEKNPDSFYFVLIDEVESLAMSRESNHQRGEPDDSLRATNAFLTGLDRLKPYPNILVMCTSNLKDSIDTAFLSRCGCNAIEVGLPSVRLQYDILKGQLQSLIEQNIIAHDTNVLPSIELAKQQIIGGSETDGARLIRLLNVIQENMEPPSARFLRQLPIKSISRYLKRKDCNLRMAFGYMERLISSMGSVLSDRNAFIENRDNRCGTETLNPDESKMTITIVSNTRKRTWQIFVDGELCQDDRKKIISLPNN